MRQFVTQKCVPLGMSGKSGATVVPAVVKALLNEVEHVYMVWDVKVLLLKQCHAHRRHAPSLSNGQIGLHVRKAAELVYIEFA